jgi:hypothetical protein
VVSTDVRSSVNVIRLSDGSSRRVYRHQSWLEVRA